MAKSLNRVTHERIEDGVVVSGRIGSSEGWADAYRQSAEEWQYDCIIANMLVHQMDRMYDDCDTAEDIERYRERLTLNRHFLATLSHLAVTPEELKRLDEYENEILNRKPA